MSDFLPKGYKPPKKPSSYMKFEEGQNKIRILTNPVIGYKYQDNRDEWNYSKEVPKIQAGDIKPDSYGNKRILHFWIMFVFDYKENKVKTLELTQSSIQDAIMEFVENPDWGNPTEYDITVTRKEENITKYSIMPSPKKPITEEIKEELKELQGKVNFSNRFVNVATAGTSEARKEVAAELKENVDVGDLPW